MQSLLTLEEARAAILARAIALPAETVPVERAAGRVVAEPALARVDLPPFASSAMDGFAVRAKETPATLPIAFSIAAGRPSSEQLPVGSAATIATGGAVPEGADAIVPVEQTVEENGKVRIAESARPEAHIRPRGGDVREGSVVVPAGVRLGPAQIGALAAAGVAEVQCSRRPRVAILATGSELRPPGDELEPGQIYESNRALIAAALAPAGAELELLPVARDEGPEHRAALDRGLAADVLVSSGGVSMGPHDLVRGWRPSWEWTRSSGASRSSRESRCRSACAGERSSSASPGTRSRRSSERSCSFVRRCSPCRAFPTPPPAFTRGESIRLSAETSSVTSSSAPGDTSTGMASFSSP